MHTLIITAIGFALLALFLALSKHSARAAMRFIPVWLICCILHLAYGVVVAGYGLVEELGVHAAVFGGPAVVAWGLSRKLSGAK